MDSSRRLSLIVGAFVIASLAALAVAILSLTSEKGIFVEHYRIVGEFENVQGLLPGAPVWLAGKEIGRVNEVSFTALGSEHPIRVELKIDVAVQERIRSDSVARVGTIGVLGDSYVEVQVGTLAGSILQDGDHIEAVSPLNISRVMAKGTAALDSFSSLADNISQLVGDVRQENVIPKAAEAVAAASDLVIEVEQGSGLLHSLIYDDYPGGGIESIEASLAHLESILAEVRDGEGILHSLIYDSMRNEDIVTDAFDTMASLKNISAKVDQGEGTLGLLINDPSLYEEARILLGGARRSAVVRSMIRMAVDQD